MNCGSGQVQALPSVVLLALPALFTSSCFAFDTHSVQVYMWCSHDSKQQPKLLHHR